jgi:two-component system OmpR family response regulator
LLVEDDMQTAAAIEQIVRHEQMTLDHVETGEAALQFAGTAAIDVIVVDWMLPGIAGIDLIARLRGASVEKPILMLSALGRSEHRIEGLDRGADDYLAKPFDPPELIARLRALYRRTTIQSRQPVLIHGDLELNVRARTAHRAGKHLGLSPKEFELLKYLMENAGNIVTREMLLRQVWKLNFDPQTNVIDVNLVRLRRKLEDGFDRSVLETVRGQGYRLVDASIGHA